MTKNEILREKKCIFEEHRIVLNLDRGTTQGPWRLNQFGFVLISSYLILELM